MATGLFLIGWVDKVIHFHAGVCILLSASFCYTTSLPARSHRPVHRQTVACHGTGRDFPLPSAARDEVQAGQGVLK